MRRVWIKLFVLAVAVGLSLLLCEIGLRIIGASSAPIGRTDDHRGWSLRPGAESMKSLEGSAFVSINADGLRADRDYPLEPERGKFRIAVLGDSFTLGAEVGQAETYVSVLARELSKCSALDGREPETINFGVAGYSTAQELLTYRHHVRKYHPDLVLLGIFTANDIANNSRSLNRDDPTAPYFLLEQNGTLSLDDSFRSTSQYRKKKWSYALLNRSRLAQVIHRALQSGDAGERWDRTAEQELSSQVDPALYREPSSGEWRQAWEVTEAILKQLRDEVRADGAGLVLATLTNPIQVYPDLAQRNDLVQRIQVEDLTYPDRRLSEFGMAAGIETITLVPRIARVAEREGVFFHGFDNTAFGVGHWNVRGHEIAGQLIAEDLCALLSE